MFQLKNIILKKFNLEKCLDLKKKNPKKYKFEKCYLDYKYSI
jgi:hypothetical protein